MKFTNICKLFAGLAVVVSGQAFGQACTATAGAIASAPFNATTDLCTLTDQITQSCGNSTQIGNAKDAIYSVTLGAGATGTFTVTPANTYQAYIALLQGASCNSTDVCNGKENESASVGAATSVDATGLAAGTYFFLISNLENTTCGSYTLNVTPTLPVQLQKFSVE